MAKFCGKCGAKLDEATGLCPKCDADKLAKLSAESAKENEKPQVSAAPDRPLSKREIKKQKKATQKAKKKEKRAGWSTGKKVRILIGKLLLCLVLLLAITCSVIGGLSYFGILDIPVLSAIREEKLLEFINEKCIAVEEVNILMESDTEGIATIIVQMPDYELLFKNASSSENPEQYLLRSLILGNYDIQKFEEIVDVTVENGVTTIHSDEAVLRLLEENLINAINSIRR